MISDLQLKQIAPFFTTETASETSSVWNVLVESVYTTL